MNVQSELNEKNHKRALIYFGFNSRETKKIIYSELANADPKSSNTTITE